MSKIIFFDTETTGNTDTDTLCQLAYKTGSETFNQLYKPEKKIPPEASAVHHITNKMVADKPSFQNSRDYENVKSLFEHRDTIMVAHNATFDIAMLARENIQIKNFICTLRVARHLDTEEKIDRYNLQYLRYLLEIEIDAAAHDAFGDVLVLEELFNRLKNKIVTSQNMTEEEAYQEMVQISSHPSILKKFAFGKYNGQRVEDVAKIDRGYLEWLLAQKLNGDGPDEDWIYTLKHYLGK